LILSNQYSITVLEIDNITVKDNLIEPYGSSLGTYGDRNAISINYGGK
jgi:hypothetical protein